VGEDRSKDGFWDSVINTTELNSYDWINSTDGAVRSEVVAAAGTWQRCENIEVGLFEQLGTEECQKSILTSSYSKFFASKRYLSLLQSARTLTVVGHDVV
jgi:hypothetical protein